MRHQCYVNLSSPWNTPGQAGFVVILAEDLRSQPAKSPASLNTKLILVDHLKWVSSTFFLLIDTPLFTLPTDYASTSRCLSRRALPPVEQVHPTQHHTRKAETQVIHRLLHPEVMVRLSLAMDSHNIRAHHRLLRNHRWEAAIQVKLLPTDTALSLTTSPTRVHHILRRINMAPLAMFVDPNPEFDRVIVLNIITDRLP
jgi:hypothetical protein